MNRKTSDVRKSLKMNNIQLTGKAENLMAPLARVFIALIFVMSGLNKIANYNNVAGWMDAMGVPGTLLPLVIMLEVLGGIAIMIGYKTRIAALLFAGFCLLSAVIFHSNFGDQNDMIHFMKNIAITGGFLILVKHGAGSYALDKSKS